MDQRILGADTVRSLAFKDVGTEVFEWRSAGAVSRMSWQEFCAGRGVVFFRQASKSREDREDDMCRPTICVMPVAKDGRQKGFAAIIFLRLALMQEGFSPEGP